jgi:hypothetical protein
LSSLPSHFRFPEGYPGVVWLFEESEALLALGVVFCVSGNIPFYSSLSRNAQVLNSGNISARTILSYSLITEHVRNADRTFRLTPTLHMSWPGVLSLVASCLF